MAHAARSHGQGWLLCEGGGIGRRHLLGCNLVALATGERGSLSLDPAALARLGSRLCSQRGGLKLKPSGRLDGERVALNDSLFAATIDRHEREPELPWLLGCASDLAALGFDEPVYELSCRAAATYSAARVEPERWKQESSQQESVQEKDERNNGKGACHYSE